MSGNDTPAIEVRGLHRAFSGRSVLAGLDLAVRAGEVHALLGHSGCGKTTLLRLIAGLDRPDSGTIRFAAVPPPRLGIVFQEPRLLPWLDVAGNLALALRRDALSPAETRSRIAAMLDLVGLSHCAALFPAQLSGGMAQRVALARALLRAPQVLLLDEPFAALNPMLRAELREELAEVRRAWGIPVLMITHDIEDVLALADVAFVYKDGQVVREIDLHTAESRELSLREAAGVPAVADTPLRSKLRGLLMQDAPGA